MNSKISVVIPIYNPALAFNICLESVLSQTYKNIEVLLVDDGSDVAHLEKIFEILPLDKRVTLIRKKHSGTAQARNTGLHLATGEYVCFLDSDDFFEKDFLEKMVFEAEKESADIVAAEFYLFDHKEKKDIFYYRYSSKVQDSITDVLNEKHIFQQLTPNVWDKLFRLSYLRENIIEFQDLLTCNDLAFTCLAISGASKISFLRLPLIHYRVNHGTNISSKRGKYAENVCKAVVFLHDQLIEKGIFESVSDSFILLAWRSIRHELIVCSIDQSCKLFTAMITILPKGLFAAIVAVAIQDTLGLIFKINQVWIEEKKLRG